MVESHVDQRFGQGLNKKIEAAAWGLFFLWVGIAVFAHVGCARNPFCRRRDLEIVRYPDQTTSHRLSCRRGRVSCFGSSWQSKRLIRHPESYQGLK